MTTDVARTEVLRLIEEENAQLVDVLPEAEYTETHIPGAINIPLAELQQRLDEIPRDQQIVVVCASGSRSISGSEVLGYAGFSEVYNLNGGTMTWMMGMRPLAR